MKRDSLPQTTSEHIPSLTSFPPQHGFRAYDIMFRSKQLMPGDEILVPRQYGSRVAVDRYVVLDSGQIRGFSGISNAKNELRGLDWYIKRAEAQK